jgi:hypothetical protein
VSHPSDVSSVQEKGLGGLAEALFACTLRSPRQSQLHFPERHLLDLSLSQINN